MTFIEFMTKFPTEKAVIDYYIKVRYGDNASCNHCGSVKVYQRHKNLKLFDCNDCNNTFSPFKGTIFEKSRTDLRKWFYAIHLFLNSKKGISGYQLQREIGVTYKTAWRILHQIRNAMANTEHQEFIDTIVEIDETYVGGKPRKGNNHDSDDAPKSKRGRGTNKIPIVGVIDRNNKNIHAKVALPNDKGQKLTGKQLMDILSEVSKAENNNTIMTDEFRGYNPLSRNNFIHLRVDHTKTYSNGNGVHTNNIESFWSTLKRGIYGIYHHVSIQHLQQYVNEFCFRYNHRGQDMFNIVLKQSVM